MERLWNDKNSTIVNPTIVFLFMATERGDRMSVSPFFNVYTTDMKRKLGKKRMKRRAKFDQASSGRKTDERGRTIKGREGTDTKETILQSDAFSAVISSSRLACTGQAQNCQICRGYNGSFIRKRTKRN